VNQEDLLLSSTSAFDRSGPVRPERRAFPRVGFDCPVRWNTGGVDRFGWARDASEGGAGFTVRSISKPGVGQTIHLAFELDPLLEWVADTEATVERCDELDDGLWNVGVRFRPLEVP